MDSQEFSSIPQFKSINSLALTFLYLFLLYMYILSVLVLQRRLIEQGFYFHKMVVHVTTIYKPQIIFHFLFDSLSMCTHRIHYSSATVTTYCFLNMPKPKCVRSSHMIFSLPRNSSLDISSFSVEIPSYKTGLPQFMSPSFVYYWHPHSELSSFPVCPLKKLCLFVLFTCFQPP